MMRRLISALLALVLIVCLLPLNLIEAKAASNMKASEDIKRYLKSMEGFTPIPEWDYAQWTVGYGNRCPDEYLEEYKITGIPIDAAEKLFEEEMLKYEQQVNDFIDRNNLTYNQHQFDAVLSITYNCGGAWLLGDSDLKKAVCNGTTGNALIGLMSQWCTAGGSYLAGLMRRRLTEAEIFMNGNYDTHIPTDYCYVFYDANGGKLTGVAQGYDTNMYAVPMVSASREGYTFLGWYTKPVGGVKVTYLDENMHQETLYAHWQAGNGQYDGGSTEIPNGVQATVTGDVLNVRSGPGTTYSVINSAVRGETVVVTQVTTGADNRLWGKIDKGWICLEYTTYFDLVGAPGTEEKPKEELVYEAPLYVSIVGDNGITVYNGPETGYPKIGNLKKGEEVLIVETYKMFTEWWGRLEKGGWICLSRYVLVHDDMMLAHPTKVTVTNSYLNVRSGPGTQYSWLDSLNKGNVVELLAVEVVDNTVWGRYSGGWISLDYTDFDRTKLDQFKNHQYGAWETLSNSTCVTHGQQERHCQICDHVETQELPFSGHTMGDWYETDSATCVEVGHERQDCIYCDYYEVRDTDLTDHVMGQWQNEKLPTCTEDGLDRKYCEYCDVYEEQIVPATGHEMGPWAPHSAPTCTEDGANRSQCLHCEYYEEEILPATGHTMGDWYETLAPTLTENGEERQDCENCDHFEVRSTDPVEHLFGDWYNVKDPTCTEEGEQRRDCIGCELFETQPVEALGHIYADWYHTQEPTCTEPGEARQDCENCDHFAVSAVDPLGHKLGDWHTIQAPTCTEAGEAHRDCERCDFCEVSAVDPLGHELGDWHVIQAPTCTEDGEAHRDCIRCDFCHVGAVDPLGHQFGDWYNVKDPTCTEAGQQRRDCENCDHYETEELSAIGHAYGDWQVAQMGNCTTDHIQVQICIHCGEEQFKTEAAPGHSMQSWYTETDSTCTAEGLQRQDCKNCDHYETKPLAKKDHIYCDWYISVEPTYEVPGQERRDCEVCGYSQTREKAFNGQILNRVYATVTCASLNVRSGPGTSYGWVATLYKGNVAEVFEQVNVDGRVWCRIEKGWICVSGNASLKEVQEVVPHVHNFGDWYTVKDATCTENGKQRRDCECGHYETQVVNATGHSFGAWYTVEAVTCTENGLRRHDCACGHYETQVVNATGHSFGAWYTAETATCTEDGLRRRDCACGHYETEVLKATGHSMGDWYTVVLATSTHKGLERQECKHCDHFLERETDYVPETVQKTYATLTENSYLNIRSGPGTNYTRVGQLVYGDRVEILETKQVGNDVWGRFERGWICLTGYMTLETVTEVVEHIHSFGDWYTVTNSTCTTAGQMRRDCLCGERETKAIAATGHSFGAWYTVEAATCTANGTRRHDCACGHYETETLNATGHSYGDWYTVQEATMTQKGLERQDCKHCDHYQQRDVDYVVETVKKTYGTLTGYDYLNIRAGVGTNYSLVGKLTRGDRVEILEIKDLGYVQWGRIAQGWIQLTNYITLEEVEEPVEHIHSFGDWYTAKAATCTAEGQLRRDCVCGEQETKAVNATGHSMGDWYTVQVATAAQAGLERQDCAHCDHYAERPVAYQAPTVTKVYATITVYSLNVRSGPGSHNSYVAYVVKGAVYEVLEQTVVDGKVWGRIEKGWICLTGYATLEEVTETVEEVEATSMTVQAKVLNVRSGAGTEYKVVTSLGYGTEVKVLEQKTVSGTVWARIDQGWVSMAYLT